MMRETTPHDEAINANRPEERMDSSKIKRLHLLLHYLSKHKTQTVLAGLSLVLAAAMVLAFGVGVRYLIDNGFLDQTDEALTFWISALVGIVALLSLASYGRSFYVSWLGERVITSLRQDVFNHLLRLDVNFFETTKAGELISRITTDTSLVQIVVGNSAALLIRNVLLMMGGTFMMLATSTKLSFYTLLVVPVVIIPIVLLGKVVRTYSKKSQDKIALFSGYLDETLNNIRSVQAFNHENLERHLFRNHSEQAFKASVTRIRARSIMVFCVMLLIFGAIAFVIWSGAQEVMTDRMTSGELSAFIFYAVVVSGSMGSFSEIVSDLQRAAGAFDRILELFNYLPSIKQLANPKKMPEHSKGILAIHNVSFAYPSNPNKLVLNKVTLSLTPGENLAIVGPSGAGKSTLLSLLLRFYDPQSGSVYMDGLDIKDVSLSDLRSRIGIVPQDPSIFSTSIYENILYGNPKATEEEVWRSIDMVKLGDVIKTLPHGVNTIVGNRGVRLSGGQKQRVAIARAILRNPSILLLDEATNALDSESEKAVQDSLRHLMATRTTIIIAHRLATVLSADRIAVMDRGEIQSIGTHAELIGQDGLYRRLATLQFDDAVALKSAKKAN